MNEHTQSGIYDLAQTPSGEIIISLTLNDIFLKRFALRMSLSSLRVDLEVRWILTVCPLFTSSGVHCFRKDYQFIWCELNCTVLAVDRWYPLLISSPARNSSQNVTLWKPSTIQLIVSKIYIMVDLSWTKFLSSLETLLLQVFSLCHEPSRISWNLFSLCHV